MEHELDFISRFMDKDINDISFYDTVYDTFDMPTYLLVEFHSGGYAIMLRTTARVMECTYSGRNPYWDFSSEKKVYVGAKLFNNYFSACDISVLRRRTRFCSMRNRCVTYGFLNTKPSNDVSHSPA